MSQGKAFKSQFQRTESRLLSAFDDLSPEEAASRPHGLAAPSWQLGHVALVDARAVRRCGLPADIPAPFEEVFSGGAVKGEAPLPPVAGVVEWFKASCRTVDALLELPLDAPATGSKLYGTVEEALLFLVYHRAYHLGKLATLRALLGKPRLFG